MKKKEKDVCGCNCHRHSWADNMPKCNCCGEKDWEKEFDEKFPQGIYILKGDIKMISYDASRILSANECGTVHQKIKEFISQTFISKQKLREELEGVLKETDNKGYIKTPFADGYTQALKDIIDIIKKLI
jgi:hypothetical protein